MGPEKGTQHLEKTQKNSAPFINLFLGLGLLRKAQHCSSHIFDNISSLHYVSLRSRPHTTDHPYDYDFACVFAAAATPGPLRAGGSRR